MRPSTFAKKSRLSCENGVDMKLPKIDLKELDRVQKQNKKERLAFLDFYAKWIKNKKFKTNAKPAASHPVAPTA